MTGLLALAVTVALATAAGLLWRSRRGVVRDVAESASGGAADDATWRELGVDLGDRATLVQFSSAFCAPCRATRRILTEVASMVDGVTYAEVDAEAHLDTVRSLRILRTPTTLVLDASGRVVVRASGQPRKADVLAALGRVARG